MKYRLLFIYRNIIYVVIFVSETTGAFPVIINGHMGSKFSQVRTDCRRWEALNIFTFKCDDLCNAAESGGPNLSSYIFYDYNSIGRSKCLGNFDCTGYGICSRNNH